MTMAMSGAIAAISAGSSAMANPRTMVFGDSNGVSFGLSGSTITASILPGGGGGESLSFSNANNVSFGKAGSTITASASFSQSVQPQSAFVFSDGGGVSFGTNGSTVTATVKTDYLTTAAQSNHVHGQYLTTAMASNAGTLFMGTSERGNYFATAGNTFANSTHSHGNVAATNISATSASNGLSLSVAAQSVQTQSRFNATVGGNSAGAGALISSGVMTFAGGNNITLSQNGNAITISGANVGGAQTGISGLSAGTTQMTSGTAVFSNSNGISFGANGNTITASHNGLTTAAISNHSHGNPTLALTNLSGTTASNSNGLTLSLSAAAGGGGADGYNILAAGTQTATTAGTVLFSNANGISFGMSDSTRITASHNGLTTARASNDGIGLNTAATNVTWTVNSGGISLNAGAYLTTAAQSGHSHGVTLNLTNINGTTGGNSAGINLSLSAVVPAQTVQTQGMMSVNGSTGNVSLVAASSLSLSQNASTISIGLASNITTALQSAGAYLTTAAQSGHSHGNPVLNLTNISGTTASNSAGLTLSLSAAAPGAGGGAALSAGTQSANTGTIAFANSNGISFGMSGSNQITASYTVPTIPGATSFSNSNNVSFGLNGSTITATATFAQSVQTQGMVSLNAQTGALSLGVGSSLSSSVNGASTTFGLASNITTALQSAGAYLTTAAQSNHSHGNPTLNLTNISGTTASASNGLTISLSAAAPGAGGGAGLSAGTQSVSTGTIAFANSNGITFGMSGSNQITASHNALTTAMQSQMTSNYMSTAERGNYFYTSNNTFANSTHSHGNPTLNLTNISGTTASGSNGLTLSLSAGAGGAGGGIGMISASVGSFTSGTVIFSASNGISFGLNTINSLLTASHNGAISNHSHGNPTLALTNLSGTTASASNGLTLWISNNNPAFSAGNGSLTAQTLSFGNAGGVSFSTSNGSIVASAPAGGGGGGVTYWGHMPSHNHALDVVGQIGQNSIFFVSTELPTFYGDFICLPLQFTAASNSTNSIGLTLEFGFYGTTNSPMELTRLSTYVFDWTIPISGTLGNYSRYSNRRLAQIYLENTIPAGQYVLAIRSSTSGGGGSVSNVLVSKQTSAFNGIFGGTTYSRYQQMFYQGVFNVTSAALPASVHQSGIIGTGSAHVRTPLFFFAPFYQQSP